MVKKVDVQIEYVPLSELTRHERNPKEHDLGEIRASIRRFGYTSPIIIDEKTQKIVAGHGRLDTLSEMRRRGESPPERIRVKGEEWLVPVIKGVSFEDEREAEAYLLADNRITEIGGWNDEVLGEILKDHEDDLMGLGFDLDDLERGEKRGQKEEIKGEVEFTEELFESSNYVVLYFDNDVDWLQAQSLFGFETVKALHSKIGFERKGIGKVLNGPKALRKIVEGKNENFS